MANEPTPPNTPDNLAEGTGGSKEPDKSIEEKIAGVSAAAPGPVDPKATIVTKDQKDPKDTIILPAAPPPEDEVITDRPAAPPAEKVIPAQTTAAEEKKPAAKSATGEAVAAAPEEESAETKLNSKFISDENIDKLLAHIGRDRLARELEEVLAMSDKGKTAFGKDEKGNATLTLGVNQHAINFSTLPDGRDFIGLNKAHSEQFDAHDARALVGLAKSRGWESINVHGNEGQKGALWLEAMRMGLAVKDYAPQVGSPAAVQWEKEKDALPNSGAPTITEAAAAMGLTPAAAAPPPPAAAPPAAAAAPKATPRAPAPPGR